MPESYKPNGPHARELGKISARLEALFKSVDQLHDEYNSLRQKVDALEEKLTVVRARMFFIGGFLVLFGAMIGGVLQKYGITFLR